MDGMAAIAPLKVMLLDEALPMAFLVEREVPGALTKGAGMIDRLHDRLSNEGTAVGHGSEDAGQLAINFEGDDFLFETRHVDPGNGVDGITMNEPLEFRPDRQLKAATGKRGDVFEEAGMLAGFFVQ